MRKTITTIFLSLIMTVTLIPSFSYAAGNGGELYDHQDAQKGRQFYQHEMSKLAEDDQDEDQEQDEEQDTTFSDWKGHVLVDPGESATLTTFTYDGASALYMETYCYYCQDEDEYNGEKDLILTVFDNTEDAPLEMTDEFGFNYSHWFYYGPDGDLPESLEPNLTEGHEYSLILENDEESAFQYGVDFWCRACHEGFAKTIKMEKTYKRQAGDYGYILPKASNTDNPDDNLMIVTGAVSDNSSVLEASAFGNRVQVFPKKPGKSTKVTVNTLNGQKFTITVNTTNGVPQLKGDDGAGFIELNRGEKVKLGIQYNNKKVTWSTTNKKVAKVYKGQVTAVDPGQCMIKAKCGGYTCKCVIEVYRLDPEFEAEIEGFDNIKKTIDIKVTNHGVKKLTVYSAKAGYYDGSSEENDRNLKFKKGTYVNVAAGTAKTIKYKIVKGTFDWDPLQTDGAAVKFRYKYDGMKYDGHTD